MRRHLLSSLPTRLSQWNEVFADAIIASAINIKGESYQLKEHKEFMRQKQQIVHTLFEQEGS